MKRPVVRSKGVNDTLVMPSQASGTAAGEGFEALYRSSRDDVYAYVAALLRDRSAAEDVTASVFERAYRKRSSFSARRGSRRAWLFGIARNAALDELRRRRRQAPLLGEQADDAQAELPDPTRTTVVKVALAQLEPRERDLIALKFNAGLSNAEIARVLSITESNAGTSLHRVITKLRKACNEIS
jgi:RNA polymerase sigma-70 factor, ECF subfamily